MGRSAGVGRWVDSRTGTHTGGWVDNGQMDRQVGARTDEQMHGRMHGQMHGRMHGQMHGRMHGGTDGPDPCAANEASTGNTDKKCLFVEVVAGPVHMPIHVGINVY